MDLENLGSAPDIDNIDISTLDKGNDLPSTDPAPVVEPETKIDTAKEALAEIDKAAEPKKAEEAPKDEPKGEEEKPVEEAPRDDKGRFEARIPKSRFDEAVGKERDAREAAEARAAELERRLQQAQAQAAQSGERAEQIKQIDSKLDELEKQHAELLLDGKVDDAAKVQREMRQLNRTAARLEATDESTATTSAQLESERLDASIARIEADYPTLNPKSENYDPEVVQMILLVQGSMVQNGIPASFAMEQAAERVMARLSAPAPKEEAKKDETLEAAKNKKDAEDRKEKAVEKAMSAQKSQPSSLKDAGLDSDKAGEHGLPDVSQMSAEEYDALPAATKARLRGDMV